MDDRFYRGARPKEGKGQFKAMKALGIDTIIDLSDKPRSWEKTEAEAAGLRYVHLPIVDKQPPTEQNLADFSKLIDDPSTGEFFVHCGGGRHRTGNIGAFYRFTRYGWDYDRVYEEMKNYDFYSSWGHGKQKDWVKDYAVKVEADRATAAAAAASAGTAGAGPATSPRQ
jgi:protein tyrosine/serine phosphatase